MDGRATYKIGEKRNLFAKFQAAVDDTLTVVGTPTFQLFGPARNTGAATGFTVPVNVDNFNVGPDSAITVNYAPDTSSLSPGTYTGEFVMQATTAGGSEVYKFIATIQLILVAAND